MSVYQPTYIDRKGQKKKQAVWWYSFVFDGIHIQESSKSPRKTIAIEAERKRRLELERGFNGIVDQRRDRIRTIADTADEYLEGYKLRNPRSTTFATYALGHVKDHLGKMMRIAVNDRTVKEYQTARLKEGASPNSINDETVFLLRLLGEQGDAIRAKMRRERTLKLSVKREVARAFSVKEKAALLREARKRRSPHIYPALMLALNAGMRDAEIRGLQWGRVDLTKALITVGTSKTEAGEGRTIPMNVDVRDALVAHSKWYLRKFGETRPEWFVFAFGQPQPTDPAKPARTFKTVWTLVKKDAGVKGRWHDNRHTFITDLAECPEVSDETIRDLAGHVSKQMLRHYSHIRMEAKRKAVDSLIAKPQRKAPKRDSAAVPDRGVKESAKVRRLT